MFQPPSFGGFFGILYFYKRHTFSILRAQKYSKGRGLTKKSGQKLFVTLPFLYLCPKLKIIYDLTIYNFTIWRPLLHLTFYIINYIYYAQTFHFPLHARLDT